MDVSLWCKRLSDGSTTDGEEVERGGGRERESGVEEGEERGGLGKWERGSEEEEAGREEVGGGGVEDGEEGGGGEEPAPAEAGEEGARGEREQPALQEGNGGDGGGGRLGSKAGKEGRREGGKEDENKVKWRQHDCLKDSTLEPALPLLPPSLCPLPPSLPPSLLRQQMTIRNTEKKYNPNKNLTWANQNTPLSNRNK